MRYLRLYLYFLQFSFSGAMTFRIDFYFRIIMDAVYYILHIMLFHFIYLHTSQFGGWSESEIYIFVGIFFCVDAINMSIFGNNLWWLPIFINRGDLDFHLIRPVNSLFFLSLRDFAANSFMNLIMALVFLVWAIYNSSISYSLTQYLFLPVSILVGSFLYYLIHMLFIIPVFWTQSSKGFAELWWPITKIMEKPDRIFKGFIRSIFIFVIPLHLMASYPARFFIEGIRLEDISVFLSVIIIFFVLLIYFWNKGIKSYSSASS